MGITRRQLSIAVATLALLMVGAEVTLRYVVGLGDPPLYLTDTEIEYMLVPGTYHRFGNTIHVNSVHMRSSEAVSSPPLPGERRVLILGDSVVNGGSLTDQSALATEVIPLLARNAGLCTNMTVCNVSAGSWGPGNLLAYVRRFGLFGCKDAVIVLNSADAFDVPTFQELGPEHPTTRPRFALMDLTLNYGVRLFSTNSPGVVRPQESSATDFTQLLDFLIQNGVHCSVMLHLTRQELLDRLPCNVEQLETVAEIHHVPWCSTASRFLECFDDEINPYRDHIHPNEAGQLALAQAILDCLTANK
jgi:hypothetical protein